jgi:two-component sensor histidine kinase
MPANHWKVILQLSILLSLPLQSWGQLDSIQALVDSEDKEKHYSGLIGLAEYYFDEGDTLTSYVLERAVLEEADLPNEVYRELTQRKAEVIKRLYDYQEGLKVLEKALEYSREKDDSISISKWHELRSGYYYYLFEYDSSRAELNRGIRILDLMDLQEEKGNLILKSGVVDYAMGNYEKAIKSAFAATEIFKKHNKEKQLGIAYLQLGNIYYFLNSFNEAETFYEMAASNLRNSNDEHGLHSAISNLGLVQIEKGEYEEGIRLQHQMLREFRKEKRYMEIGNCYYYLGKAYSGLKRYDSSDYYIDLSILSNQKSGYDIGIGYAYWVKAKNRLEKGMLDSAKYFNHRALSIVDTVESFELEKILQKQRSVILEKEGNFAEAYASLKKSISIKDSLNINYESLSQMASRQLAKLESAEYELELARQREEQQAVENNRQQQLIIAISIIAFLLVFFVIGLVHTNRRNRSLHKQLIQNKNTIEHELITKKALLKEIHHRVKNNLQIISSMLSIQSQYINDPRLDEVIGECRSRIVSMSLIHESLYKKEDEEQSLFSKYIKQLLPQLIDTYQLDKNQIDLQMEIEEFELSLDDSVPCGLLINEIVSNSLKHAFPDDKNGKITLKMFKSGKDMVLQISDDGIGLKEEVDPSAQDTFGFLLIYTLAAQLEANILVSREGGVAFDIRWETKMDKLLS